MLIKQVELSLTVFPLLQYLREAIRIFPVDLAGSSPPVASPTPVRWGFDGLTGGGSCIAHVSSLGFRLV
jgi:hypothetical protein